jgi:hypothetical protein
MACRVRLERRRACLQPQGELMARKSKEIKANLLFSLLFILANRYFSKSYTKKNKKIERRANSLRRLRDTGL